MQKLAGLLKEDDQKDPESALKGKTIVIPRIGDLSGTKELSIRTQGGPSMFGVTIGSKNSDVDLRSLVSGNSRRAVEIMDGLFVAVKKESMDNMSPDDIKDPNSDLYNAMAIVVPGTKVGNAFLANYEKYSKVKQLGSISGEEGPIGQTLTIDAKILKILLPFLYN